MKTQILALNAKREAYSVNCCYDTITVGELCEQLQNFPKDMKIYTNSDGGVMGSISSYDIKEKTINQIVTYHEKEPLIISKEDFNRIKQLLNIDFDKLDLLEGDKLKEYEALLDSLDARPETTPYSMSWYFEKTNRRLSLEVVANDKEYHLEFAVYDPDSDKWIEGDDWSWDWHQNMAAAVDGDIYNFSFNIQ